MIAIPKYYPPVNLGRRLFGSRVEATFNSEKLTQGKDFSANQFGFVSQLGKDWQKGHLLGVQFGGIADERNFLPMTQKANLAFKENVEDKLREIILWHDAFYLLKKHIGLASYNTPWMFQQTILSSCMELWNFHHSRT